MCFFYLFISLFQGPSLADRWAEEYNLEDKTVDPQDDFFSKLQEQWDAMARYKTIYLNMFKPFLLASLNSYLIY